MTAPATVRTSLLVLAYVAFVSLALPDGLLGVGWPSMRSTLGVSTEAVGLLLFAGTAGYLTSSVAAGFTIARLGVGWLLAGSTALTGVALAGFGLSPAFAVLIPCALLGGFGGGAIDSGLNAYAAGAFGPRQMNWMHAFFGLGATLGPLIMTGTLGAGLSWRWGYGIVATAQCVLALAFVRTARMWAQRSPTRPVGDAATATAAARPRSRETLVMPAVWLGVAAFAVYVAIEVGAGLWAFLFLTDGRGLSATVAGLCVSGYWGSLLVGRVLHGVAGERLKPSRVLVASLVGMAAGALVMAVPGPGWLAVFGLAVLGFAAAPVFPLLTLTTADRVGAAHADRAIGMQIAGAGLGAALIPAGIGVLLSRTAVTALGPALLVLCMLLIALYATMRRSAARPRVHGGADVSPIGPAHRRGE
ncbi:MAG TPA: MFS transporter [Micromonosporaceae bacterium]|nr:MFS transporter [Micromonosporaceae bacterium]